MKIIDGFKRAYNKSGSTWFTVGSLVFAGIEFITAYNAGKRSGQHPEWDLKQKALNVVVPAGATLANMTCTVAAQQKNVGDIAALISANVLNEKKRQEIIKKAEETIGEENMEKIRASLHPVKDDEYVQNEDGKVLFIDDFTGARSYSTPEEMYAAIDRFHAYLHTHQFAPYGKLLEYGGFERFDGVERCLPFTEDAYGEPMKGLSDSSVGYSCAKNWQEWDTDWVDIKITRAKSNSEKIYYIVEPDKYPSADYLKY